MKLKMKPLLLRIFDFRMWFYDFAKITGALFVLLWFRPKYIYKDNKKIKKIGPFIVASNHNNVCSDPIVTMLAFPFRRFQFIASDTVYSNLFFKISLTGFRCIKINRNNPKLNLFKEVGDCLSSGHLLGIFPEGGVEKNNEVMNFKNGIILLATLNQVDISPIYIKKRKSIFERQKIYFGEKINPSKMINNKIPSVDDIEKITIFLLEKEKELEKLSKNN